MSATHYTGRALPAFAPVAREIGAFLSATIAGRRARSGPAYALREALMEQGLRVDDLVEDLEAIAAEADAQQLARRVQLAFVAWTRRAQPVERDDIDDEHGALRAFFRHIAERYGARLAGHERAFLEFMGRRPASQGKLARAEVRNAANILDKVGPLA